MSTVLTDGKRDNQSKRGYFKAVSLSGPDPRGVRGPIIAISGKATIVVNQKFISPNQWKRYDQTADGYIPTHLLSHIPGSGPVL